MMMESFVLFYFNSLFETRQCETDDGLCGSQPSTVQFCCFCCALWANYWLESWEKLEEIWPLCIDYY